MFPLVQQPSFLERAIRAWLVGLPGVIVLPLLVDAPAGVPAAALALGPMILLTAAALAGAWASTRAGVHSRLILRDSIAAADLVGSFVIGLLAGFFVALADHALVPVWRGEAVTPASLLENVSWRSSALGILYGGLTEEVILRWGVASVIAALALVILPRRVALAIAIVASAALFAAAHLPAAFAGAEVLQDGVIIRILGWNALFGILFGAIFFGRGLEAAILAHAGFHCAPAIASLV